MIEKNFNGNNIQPTFVEKEITEIAQFAAMVALLSDIESHNIASIEKDKWFEEQAALISAWV